MTSLVDNNNNCCAKRGKNLAFGDFYVIFFLFFPIRVLLYILCIIYFIFFLHHFVSFQDVLNRRLENRTDEMAVRGLIDELCDFKNELAKKTGTNK